MPHTANRWNFVNFQSPSYSALMMEFTTPPSYGSTVVNVGCLTTPTSLLYAGSTNTATHLATTEDPDARWPEPTRASYHWAGPSVATAAAAAEGDEAAKKSGGTVDATLEGELGARRDRIDVMAEVPQFIKKIAETAAGTRPYIYQYTPRLKIRVKVDGEEKEEEGTLFTEATFIS